MADSEVRQRKSEKAPENKTQPRTTKSLDDDQDAYSPWVDVLRVLTFLFVVSCGLSYVISGGESWFWGIKDRPSYLKVDWWKSQLVGQSFHWNTYSGLGSELN